MPVRRASAEHREPTEDTSGNMTLAAPPVEPADQAAATGADADAEGDP